MAEGRECENALGTAEDIFRVSDNQLGCEAKAQQRAQDERHRHLYFCDDDASNAETAGVGRW